MRKTNFAFPKADAGIAEILKIKAKRRPVSGVPHQRQLKSVKNFEKRGINMTPESKFVKKM
jgi:hypothetical protein